MQVGACATQLFVLLHYAACTSCLPASPACIACTLWQRMRHCSYPCQTAPQGRRQLLTVILALSDASSPCTCACLASALAPARALPAVATLARCTRVLMKTAENSNSTDLIRAHPLCRQHPRCTEATARLPMPSTCRALLLCCPHRARGACCLVRAAYNALSPSFLAAGLPCGAPALHLNARFSNVHRCDLV